MFFRNLFLPVALGLFRFGVTGTTCTGSKGVFGREANVSFARGDGQVGRVYFVVIGG